MGVEGTEAGTLIAISPSTCDGVCVLVPFTTGLTMSATGVMGSLLARALFASLSLSSRCSRNLHSYCSHANTRFRP